ncbi:hypothetical protein [Pseudescherichia sp.]|uniref:hypothetical protein n=1 Tax=Pseudescherichia sp. TaxID=2055881 RepID=UPI0028B0845A|nr:hypothetical protein [Pseudescherichia sp.]
MTERGMIFNAEMVRALLDGRKTQTRRIIQSAAKNMQARGHEVISHREPGDRWYGDHVYSMRDRSGVWQDFTNEEFLAKCPFGVVGDRIWVREAFRVMGCATDVARLMYKASERNSFTESTCTVPVASCTKQPSHKWTPSIHMPRWASRLTLEITNVGVQRLQSISQNDAAREGLVRLPASGRYCINQGDQYFGGASHDAREVFSWLWSSIYGDDSWQANPWVWVIEFRRVDGEAV